MAPTPLPLPPLPTISFCPPYEYSVIDPTNETEVERIKAAAGAPVDTSTDAPTAGPTPRPAGAPPTDDSTDAPTAEPTPQACDSPEKFYPNADHQLADEGSGPDGWKLTSEHSQKNPYSVVGFAAWADAGIAYGGFYGGNVTCYDADCIEDALEKKSPLIIHLGQDINLGSARYKIKGDKDHDDKTLEGHGFTLKYSGDDGEAPLFTDNGASNLVIRNVRFENTGKDSPAIQIRDDANHVVLDQCTFACSEPGKCGYAVTVEAPATFVTIQRCLFDQVRKGIRVRNKAGDNGAGRLTVVECYFRNCEKESPDAEVGWIHMASNVVEGGGDGDGMIKTDPDNGGVPEILVDGGKLSVAEGKLYKKSGGGLIAAVPGVTNSDPEAPDALEDLSWCVPYDYTPIDGFDDAAVETIKENAGSHLDDPGSEPTGEPTAEPTAESTPRPTPMPTVAPNTEAPVVTGTVALSGITVAEAEASKAVLQDAIADVAGVTTEAVTILSVASTRRRLQEGGVVVAYKIESNDFAEAADAADKLQAAADEPSVVDTAIEEAAKDANAEAVFAGVSTEWLTYDVVAATDAPTVAPTPQPTSTPTARPSSEPTPAPTTPMPTPGPTMEPTAGPFEPLPTCPVVKLIDSAACPEFCPSDCKDPKIGPGMQCSGDGICASDDQGVLCTCKHLRRRLLADPEEDQVYVFDVAELGECVPCGAGGACDVGECLPDNRRRGLRFGMSTSGCCRGA